MEEEEVDVCGIHSKVVLGVGTLQRCVHAYTRWNKMVGIELQLSDSVFVIFSCLSLHASITVF